MRFFLAVLYLYFLQLYSIDSLNLDTAAERIAGTSSVSLPRSLWDKFDNFLHDPDFLERSVLTSLDEKFPELPQLISRLDTHQLLKTACLLKRLHFLTATLKEAYENLFYMLEFSIQALNAESINQLWSCVTGCGYQVPNSFFEKLDHHTARKADYFDHPLVLSTLQHLCFLKEGRAFNRFVRLFSEIDELVNPNELHLYILLNTYLTHVKERPINISRRMKASLKRYRNRMKSTESNTQRQVVHFLTHFDEDFRGETFHKDLDMYLDIVHKKSRKVIEVDGMHHYKEDILGERIFKRPLDSMIDAILKKLGWNIYRIRITQWNAFKEDFSSKMHKQETFDTFFMLYADE